MTNDDISLKFASWVSESWGFFIDENFWGLIAVILIL